MTSEPAIYRRAPRGSVTLSGGAVPVFSDRDRYVENYEKIAADHLAHLRATGANPFIPERLWIECERITADLLRRYGAAGARVLDVGCGLGRLLDQFPELRRHGMDISAAYLEHAQAKGIDVCLARVEDMPYSDGLFDVVVCTDVLEHVLDLHAACTQLLRVVRDNGVLIVRVPNREDLTGYLAPDLPYEFVHVRAFDEPGLRLLFERIHGCTVEALIVGPFVLPWVTLRYRVPLPGLGHLARALARASGVFGRRAQEPFLRALFDGFEINAVVRVRPP